MLDLVGEKSNTLELDQFLKGWIAIISRSTKAKLTWKIKTGLAVPTYSASRRWSKWDVLQHMHDVFENVCTFLEDCSLLPSRLKLLGY